MKAGITSGWRTVALTVCCAMSVPSSAGEPMMIENESLQVTFDANRSSFSVVDKASHTTFVAAGQLGGRDGTAQVVPVTDATFGVGQQIQITYPQGNREAISLFPRLPFALFHAMLHNASAEDVLANHVRVVSADVSMSKSWSELRALGTAGLTAVDRNPGSYAYLAVVDPGSRAGIVGGWLTHDRGSGVVFSPVESDVARVVAQIDYGRLRIKPGQDAQTETFALGWFDDARLGLESYAGAIARVYAIKLPAQPAGYCTWYADKHGGACDEKHLAELAAFAAQHLKPFGFEFVQIDDGWQDGVSTNGPCRNFTAHRPAGPYPGGMQAMASQIKGLGLTPGIWFMPFAGTHYDPFFEEHQEWFAQDAHGKPFETTWGGTCLDMTHAGARQHLRSVVQRIAHEWGFRVFKMDGLWTGTATRLMYVNDGYQDDQIGESRLSDPDKTPVEAYRDGLQLVREVAGPDVYLLGCCVSQNMRSFGGAFGLLDAMRVGPDTGAGHIGAPHGSRNYFLHGRIWQNDPDCVSVRSSTSLDQARLNASWTAISGQLFYSSDWLPDLPADRLDILRRTMPAHGLLPRPVDLFEHDPARIWLLTDTRQSPRRDVVAFYNWDQERAVTVACATSRLGLPAAVEYVAFDFWADKFVRPFRAALSAELPAASCRVLAVQPVSDRPQLLSTSRHVTQGMVDVRSETWNTSAHTLSGISRVVGADPYELRIVVPIGEGSWLAREVGVSDEDGAAGTTTSFRQEGPKLRARISSPTSRDVHWHVTFERGRVEPEVAEAVQELRAVADYGSVTLTWREQGAESYRVERSDGTTFECADATCLDTSVAHGEQYTYTVRSISWDGSLSAPTACDVRTPAELQRPPQPPAPGVYLGDLQPVHARQDWGSLGVGKSVEGQPLTVAGQRYEHGLGTHANSLLIYTIPSGATRFVAVVGLDDEKRDDPRSSVTFEVYGDVKEMGESPVLIAKSPKLWTKTLRSWAFDVELSARFRELRLVVTDAGDGIAADHADWVDAGFFLK